MGLRVNLVLARLRPQAMTGIVNRHWTDVETMNLETGEDMARIRCQRYPCG